MQSNKKSQLSNLRRLRPLPADWHQDVGGGEPRGGGGGAVGHCCCDAFCVMAWRALQIIETSADHRCLNTNKQTQLKTLMILGKFEEEKLLLWFLHEASCFVWNDCNVIRALPTHTACKHVPGSHTTKRSKDLTSFPAIQELQITPCSVPTHKHPSSYVFHPPPALSSLVSSYLWSFKANPKRTS